MEKINKFLLASTCLLAGVIIGFCFAPIKKGISMGNNNKSHCFNSYVPGEDIEADDEDDVLDDEDMSF